MPINRYHKEIVERSIKSVIDDIPNKYVMYNYLCDLSKAAKDCKASKFTVAAYLRYAQYVKDMDYDAFKVSLYRCDFI